MSSTAHGATSVREHAFNINRAIDAVNFGKSITFHSPFSLLMLFLFYFDEEQTILSHILFN